MVVDLSTNGVYLNTTDAPLGRGNAAVLVDGDVLYIGTYVIAAEIRHVHAEPGAQPQTPPARAPFAPAIPPAPIRTGVAFTAGTPHTSDPIADLDRQSLLQGDNPFSDLGIGQGEGGDGTAGAPGDIDSFLRPAPARPTFDFTPGPAAQPPARAPARMAPADAPPAPAPVVPPPSAPSPLAPAPSASAAMAPPALAPVAPPVAETPAVIPPNFLDELSILIPRLAKAGADHASALAPQPPMPAQAAPMPPVPTPMPDVARADVPAFPAPVQMRSTDLDDPEEMVTLLRMRGKGKTPAPAAPLPAPALPPALAPEPVAPVRPILPAAPPPIPAPAPPLPPSPAMAAAATEADLWRLLGVDAGRLTMVERDRLLGEVGTLLRVLVQGLQGLATAQGGLQGGSARSPNPFAEAASPEQALARAFRGAQAGAPGATAAAQIAQMIRQEQSAMDAMALAVADILDRVSPAAIAFDLEDEGPSNGIFARKADKTRLWDRYLMVHERLMGALDVVTGEAMARAVTRLAAEPHPAAGGPATPIPSEDR